MKNDNNIFQFRYATRLDMFFIFIGTVGGLAHGTLLPLMVLVFGNLLNAFTDRTHELCANNYTALAIEYCPQGYPLTISNYFSSFT